MNDATKLRIRRDLAERMGYVLASIDKKYGLKLESGLRYTQWRETENDAWDDAPDPFTSHADAAALVEWLAEQTMFIQERFHGALVARIAQYGIAPGALEYLTSPLEARVLAACEALGISTGDE